MFTVGGKIPNMATIAKVDDKRRIRIPEAKPGQELLIQATANGWSVSHLQPAVAPRRQRTKQEVLRAIKSSPLRFEVSWDKLKEETR